MMLLSHASSGKVVANIVGGDVQRHTLSLLDPPGTPGTVQSQGTLPGYKPNMLGAAETLLKLG